MVTAKEYSEILRTTKKNARTRNITFSLTRADFDLLVERANHRCEITAIPFSTLWEHAGTRRPFAPSIDRIDNALGYVPTNVRLVLVAVNVAMNDWGLKPVQLIGEALATRRIDLEKEKTAALRQELKSVYAENELLRKEVEALKTLAVVDVPEAGPGRRHDPHAA